MKPKDLGVHLNNSQCNRVICHSCIVAYTSRGSSAQLPNVRSFPNSDSHPHCHYVLRSTVIKQPNRKVSASTIRLLSKARLVSSFVRQAELPCGHHSLLFFAYLSESLLASRALSRNRRPFIPFIRSFSDAFIYNAFPKKFK